MPSVSSLKAVSMEAAELAGALEACRSLCPRSALIQESAVLLSADADGLRVSVSTFLGALSIAVPVSEPGTGRWLVALPPLRDVLARLDGPVRLEESGGRLAIGSGAFTAKLAVLAEDLAPVDRPAERWLAEMRLPAVECRRALERVAPAMPTTDVRPTLQGVLVERSGDQLVAVATDGHRLIGTPLPGAAISEDADWPERTVILPDAAVRVLRTLLPAESSGESYAEAGGTGDIGEWLTWRVSKTAYEITGPTWTLTGPFQPGPYPDWRRVLERVRQKSPTVIVGRELLAQALRRALILAQTVDNRMVRFAMSPDGLHITTKTELGESVETVAAERKEDGLTTCAINGSLLLPLVGAFDGERVALTWPEAERGTPLLLTAPGDTTVALLMPLAE